MDAFFRAHGYDGAAVDPHTRGGLALVLEGAIAKPRKLAGTLPAWGRVVPVAWLARLRCDGDGDTDAHGDDDADAEMDDT